jgi:hypothetical protein
MSALGSTIELPPVPKIWMRESRREWVDKVIDVLYEHDITRELIFEDELVHRIFDMLPKFKHDEPFQITIAWSSDDPTIPLALARRQFDKPMNMWEFHKQLAAACIVVRMRARSLPLWAPIDRSDWFYLGSMMGPDGFVDLWGRNDWETVEVRWRHGSCKTSSGHNEVWQPQVDVALSRLAAIHYGPDY